MHTLGVSGKEVMNMDKLKRRRHESNVAVRDYYTDRPTIFNGSSLGRALMAEHADVVAKSSAYFATETSGHEAARKGTTSRAEWRKIVRGAVEAISRTNRFQRIDPNGVDDTFPLPGNTSDQELIAAAKAALTNAL